MKPAQQTWQSYEELARHVLQYFAGELGISEIEAKQRLVGTSGTNWEIDAKGVSADGIGFLVIECKARSSSRINQSTVASLAYTVQDLKANGAILVTSIGLQEGAQKIASKHGFHAIYLPKECSFEEFVARCGNIVLIHPAPMCISVTFSLVSAKLETVKKPDDEKA